MIIVLICVWDGNELVGLIDVLRWFVVNVLIYVVNVLFSIVIDVWVLWYLEFYELYILDCCGDGVFEFYL